MSKIPGRSGQSNSRKQCGPLFVHGPENYQMEEVPVPTPGQGEALIKVEATGICASDLKCYHGAAKFWGDDNRPAWAETEVIPGHEFVGKVVQVDDEAANL